MMVKNHKNIYITKCLKAHRSEILKKWAHRIDEDERVFLLQTAGNLSSILSRYFEDVLHALLKKPLVSKVASSDSVHLHAVRHKIFLILLGREIFVEELRKYFFVSKELRPSDLKKIQEAFHEVLRHHSITACSNCRWVLNEKLWRLAETKSHLERLSGAYSMKKQGGMMN